MANNIPFQPMGNTVVATAASSNTQGNVVAITAVSPVNQYFVFNPNKDNPVFVAYGETANITASIPFSSFHTTNESPAATRLYSKYVVIVYHRYNQHILLQRFV